ncbi:CocE/NonD family hydrolase C-terminal non-catalytic domain-containing protein [Kitasatospora sp. NPDC050543]|uniref:CocE/NonD family hydrolase C-terminal non-catalytic domain-containing protein n=1 Tax=Kitasatospora sp. NPDC050543 TaxID=3364054 RepID=UPI00379AB599
MDGPPVRIQVGNAGSRLREESEWPLRRAVPTTFYLNPEPAHAVHSLNDGSLTTAPPSRPESRPATTTPTPSGRWAPPSSPTASRNPPAGCSPSPLRP